MSENKTVESSADVDTFLRETVTDQRLADANTLVEMMQATTGCQAKMWGKTMVGFDSYHYKYESGREGDAMITGFSPRKREFAIYIMCGFDQYQHLLAKLGKHRHGKSCLYVRQLADIDLEILNELITASVSYMRNKYG